MRRTRIAVLAAAIAIAALNAVVLLGGRAGHVEEPVDCAVVLGARVYPDGTPSDVLRDRLDEAVTLYRSGEVSRVLVTGDHGTTHYDEPDAMRSYLVEQGVPREKIFVDHAGFDTYSSMWRARNVFGATRVVVVTQGFHLPRAVWLARRMGMEAEGRASDHHVYRGMAWLELREIVSRTKATLDVARHRRPRFGGPPIDLHGEARATEG